jgi:hypothetical protein
MTKRLFIVLFAIALVGLPVALRSQSASPRMPWGAPDLQGIWLYWTETPLERPEESGEKARVTPEEAAAFVARQAERFQSEQRLSGDWNGRVVGRPGLLDGRTSLLIDPPNGRIPARTEARTSTASGRFKGPVHACASSSGLRGLQLGLWITSLRSMMPSRSPAPGRSSSH